MIAFAATTLAVTATARASSPRLLAYYSYTDQWSSPAYTSAQIPFDELTHIIHDEALVEGNGTARSGFRRAFSSRNS